MPDPRYTIEAVELPMPPDTLIKVGMLADVERHGDRMLIEGISVALCPRRDVGAEGVLGIVRFGEPPTAVEVEQIEAYLLHYAVFGFGSGGWAYGNQVRRVYNEDGSEP